MYIIPSIFVTSKEEFISQIRAIENHVTMAQLDIADGLFVDTKTWAEPDIVANEAKIDIELHLMTDDPLSELERWTHVQQVKRVLLPIEALTDVAETLTQIPNKDWQVGLVLNPETQSVFLEPYLKHIEAVMFMGVYPGAQGQPLEKNVLDKMRLFSLAHPDMYTQIDGAVNMNTIADIAATGIKGICPGSAVFRNDNSPAENIELFKQKITQLTV